MILFDADVIVCYSIGRISMDVEGQDKWKSPLIRMSVGAMASVVRIRLRGPFLLDISYVKR